MGLLQFGIPPYPNSALGGAKVEPVLHFKARVGLIKKLPAGTSISYGQTYQLQDPTKVAVLTAGYADGLPYSLGNNGVVLIKEHRCPILGRVTMDQTIVDVSALLIYRWVMLLFLLAKAAVSTYPQLPLAIPRKRLSLGIRFALSLNV